MGCGILSAYPQIAVVAGVQGVVVYAVTSALPLMLFAFAGPAIRRRCPDGFVLTAWVRQRFGIPAELYLSFFTIATMFLYMVSELSALQTAISSLTTIKPIPVMVIMCLVTTIYTALGGFETSFLTDNIQGVMILLLLIVCTISMGTTIKIDTSYIESSGLLNANKLGWQLIYIFPVAIATNDCFLSGFWLRTFASRTDRDLMIGCSIATVLVLIFLTLIGCTGLVAYWAHLIKDPVADAGSAFFLVMNQLPGWVNGFVLVFLISLSTAAFDSFISAMASSISHDLFHERIHKLYVRGIVLLIMIPSIVVATKAPNVLSIFLITDLISAAVIPTLFLGLFERFWFITGVEVIAGGLGGLFGVWIYGTAYYHSAREGGRLLIIQQGLYAGDWGAFGAFVVAPFGSYIAASIAFGLRLAFCKWQSKRTGKPFTALDKPEKVITPWIEPGNDKRDKDPEDQSHVIASNSSIFKSPDHNALAPNMRKLSDEEHTR